MATYTDNYNLKKPASDDFYNVEDMNGNSDILDTALKTQSDAIAANTSSIESLGTNKLNASDVVDNLTTESATKALSANQGKLLNDAIGQKADSSSVPTKVSQLTNDSGYLTSAPVTSVNGQTGAVTVSSPTNVSQLTNDSGYITSSSISGKADKASITAGTAGTSSATSGSTLAVPYVTMTAQGIVSGYGTHTHTVSGFAASSHSHGAGDITSGTLAVARGGTGQTTLALARNAMGLGNTTGALPIANGGTGKTTAADARSALGLGGAATYSATTSVTSGSSALVTSGAVYSAISGFKKFELVSRTGSGYSGSSYPVSVTFSSAPTVVYLLGTGGSKTSSVLFSTLTTAYVYCAVVSAYGDACYGKKSSDNKTFYYYYNYSDRGASQDNSSGYTYYYLALS